MKKFKAIINVIISILVVGYIIFIPSTVFVSLKAKQLEINRSEVISYSGILELWNIDTFEGGSIGRTKWLEKRALEFEAKNKGLFIVINNLTLEQAKLNLEKGTVPNMVSFGIGAGEILEPYVKEYLGGKLSVTNTPLSTPYMVEREIGKEAFLDCPSLTEVILGKSVNRIGAKAFSGCNNEAFHISIEGNVLKEIGEGAFMNSGIKDFDFSICPSLTTIPEYTFANSAITSASITDNITHIAEGAFFYNTSLKDINLGECSSSISPLQFAGCKNANTTGITSLTNEIGNYSYYGWEQLHKLVLPEAVSNIGDYAFAQMTSLEKITSTNLTAPDLGDNVFSGINPSNVLLTTKIDANGYKTAEQWKDFMHTLNGDADGSKEININDITTVISNICGKSQKNFIFEAADANVDERVDETDITTIVDTIMGNSNTISDK